MPKKKKRPGPKKAGNMYNRFIKNKNKNKIKQKND